MPDKELTAGDSAGGAGAEAGAGAGAGAPAPPLYRPTDNEEHSYRDLRKTTAPAMPTVVEQLKTIAEPIESSQIIETITSDKIKSHVATKSSSTSTDQNILTAESEAVSLQQQFQPIPLAMAFENTLATGHCEEQRPKISIEVEEAGSSQLQYEPFLPVKSFENPSPARNQDEESKESRHIELSAVVILPQPHYQLILPERAYENLSEPCDADQEPNLSRHIELMEINPLEPAVEDIVDWSVKSECSSSAFRTESRMSRASQGSRVTRVARQLFCCGIPYEAPSEDDLVNFRSASGI